MSEEQKIPTKEEIMGFLQEQIDVKKLQVELQELNTNLAAMKAEELKALTFIGQMTNAAPVSKEEQPQGTPHTITQEDLDSNPELVEAGVAVGDDVIIPEGQKRSLKKD
jgi:hypothetical protein